MTFSPIYRLCFLSINYRAMLEDSSCHSSYIKAQYLNGKRVGTEVESYALNWNIDTLKL
jgi:hypothetical protein